MTKTEIQDKIVNHLPLKPYGLLKQAPRVGKGRILCNTIKRNEPKSVLWVTLSTKLRDEDIPKEIKTWIGEDYLSKIKIICYPSLANLEGEYEMVILDEYQEITSLNTQNLLNGKIKFDYIVGASGSHPKHYEKKLILGSLGLTKTLDEISIDEAVDLKLIAPYTITTVPVDLDNSKRNILAGSSKKPFYQTEKANYEYLTKVINKKDEEGEDSFYLRIKRRNLILNSETKIEMARNLLNNLEGRTIIFSGNTEISEKLSPYTYNYKTDDTNLKKFINKEIDQLSLVNSGGVGFTYENVDNLIIVQTDSNKKGNITQKIARSLLYQKDFHANIYIIYIKGTVDEEWKNKALSEFNANKIIELEKYEFSNKSRN